MFKPTKEQILQAWEDRDEGRPLSKEMDLYLQKLEEREQSNAAAAESANQAVKTALRAQLRALEPEVRAEFSRARARSSDPNKVVMDLGPGSITDQYWKLFGKLQRM